MQANNVSGFYTTSRKRQVGCSVLTLLAVGIGVLSGIGTAAENAPVADPQMAAAMQWEKTALVPFWKSPIALGESVLFVAEEGKPAEATLFFRAKRIERLRSSTHETTFEEGRDYRFDAARNVLVRTDDSRIPFITAEQKFPSKDDPTPNKYPHRRGDPERFMLFGEGDFYHRLGAEVTYFHDDTDAWQGPVPTPAEDAIPRTLARLRAHEPITLAVSGDSISTGANASGAVGAPPFQPDYPHLVAAGLARAYETEVRLVNCAVGGWTTVQGLADVARPAAEKPDLVIIAYGMNDSGGIAVEDYVANIRGIIAGVRSVNPDAEFVLVSSMLPNAEWAYPRLEMFPVYRDALAEICRTEPGCALADVTGVWTELMRRKTHHDLTGNGVNHPNDFGHRIYAQTILALFASENPDE